MELRILNIKRGLTMKNISLLFSDVKNFMANEVNRLFTLILLINILIGFFLHFEIASLKQQIFLRTEQLDMDIIKAKKRVDYRYFNMTRTLEDIFNIKIDTKDGYLK